MSRLVLIIDDEQVSAQALARMLDILDYQPVVDRNADEAIRFLRQMIPDLILLDLNMRHVNGMEMLGFLKRNKRTTHVPVVMVSVNDQPEAIQKAYNAGAVGYLVKPVSIEKLESILERILES